MSKMDWRLIETASALLRRIKFCQQCEADPDGGIIECQQCRENQALLNECGFKYTVDGLLLRNKDLG